MEAGICMGLFKRKLYLPWALKSINISCIGSLSLYTVLYLHWALDIVPTLGPEVDS